MKVKINEKKQERLENLESEEFYFILFKGTLMPNNTRYKRIIMFKDVFYVENENESKEYKDIYFILEIKELLKNNLEKIENMDKRKSGKIEYPKSSYANIFHAKINEKIYSVDRNMCNEDEMKEYDSFLQEIFKILGIEDENKNQLPELINAWRNKKDSESFTKVIEQVKRTNFYCPVMVNDNDKKMIATIRNSNGDSLLLAFTSKVEAQKWNRDLNIKYEIYNFNKYADILLETTNINKGFVIDPFGANLTLDKKIIRDIKNIN